MATISVSLPSDGTTADVADYNTPVTTIVNEFNGNIDNANIKSGAGISTSKLASDNGIAAGMIGSSAISLGYAQIITSFTTTADNVLTDVTSLTATVTVPAGSRRVEVTGFARYMSTSNTGIGINLTVIEDGTQIAQSATTAHPVPGGAMPALVLANKVPTAGSHTYKLQALQEGTGTYTLFASATSPAYISVKVF